MMALVLWAQPRQEVTGIPICLMETNAEWYDGICEGFSGFECVPFYEDAW